MNKIVLILIAVLALLVMPAIAHQATPVEVSGLAVDMPYTAFAIDTDSDTMKVEQLALEWSDAYLYPSDELYSAPTRRMFYETATLESNGGILTLRGDWLANIGYMP